MAGIWRKNPKTPEGKYLVLRRDGTVPEWPWFVIGAPDEAAPDGLRGYADKAEELDYDPQYVADIREMANEWEEYFKTHPKGDPEAPPHREDDPKIIELMKKGYSA